jgi:membrane protein DedA with SNARE-associated domain
MQTRSIPEIFTDLVAQLTTLLRTEGQLARTEMSEKISQVAVGLGQLLAGAVLLIPALVILLQAGVAALVQQMNIAEPWAALIVGGAALLIGLILALVGAGRLKAERLVPNRTIHQLQRDVSVARQEARETDDYQRAA